MPPPGGDGDVPLVLLHPGAGAGLREHRRVVSTGGAWSIPLEPSTRVKIARLRNG